MCLLHAKRQKIRFASIFDENGNGMYLFNPFHATDVFWYPLKTSENQRFSDVFRGYHSTLLLFVYCIQTANFMKTIS